MNKTRFETKGIAMWSGPRNISTALMRSWENRPDCSVVDEPFYAAYLSVSSIQHPCQNEILATMEHSYDTVIDQLCSPQSTELYYQKHMTHHIPDAMDMQWCEALVHCFLIRDPAQVIASYIQKMPTVNEEMIGIRRQARLFEQISAVTGKRPAVIDSNDVLKNPEAVLSQLCQTLEVPFLKSSMLQWPTGRRDSDGVWASHWYHNVEQSTGFSPYVEQKPHLEGEHLALAEAMEPLYQGMAQYRLQP